MQRCAALGREIAEIIKGRKERVAVIASGGMSHYPGTSKYEDPEFDFDYWMISQMEIGNTEAILNLTPEQLDETGNTEMLNWAIMFGMIGSVMVGKAAVGAIVDPAPRLNWIRSRPACVLASWIALRKEPSPSLLVFVTT